MHLSSTILQEEVEGNMGVIYIQVLRQMEYLCHVCDVPVMRIGEDPKLDEVYFEHQCPRCGQKYELLRSYPYREKLMEPFEAP